MSLINYLRTEVFLKYIHSSIHTYPKYKQLNSLPVVNCTVNIIATNTSSTEAIFGIYHIITSVLTENSLSLYISCLPYYSIIIMSESKFYNILYIAIAKIITIGELLNTSEADDKS